MGFVIADGHQPDGLFNPVGTNFGSKPAGAFTTAHPTGAAGARAAQPAATRSAPTCPLATGPVTADAEQPRAGDAPGSAARVHESTVRVWQPRRLTGPLNFRCLKYRA